MNRRSPRLTDRGGREIARGRQRRSGRRRYRWRSTGFWLVFGSGAARGTRGGVAMLDNGFFQAGDDRSMGGQDRRATAARSPIRNGEPLEVSSGRQRVGQSAGTKLNDNIDNCRAREGFERGSGRAREADHSNMDREFHLLAAGTCRRTPRTSRCWGSPACTAREFGVLPAGDVSGALVGFTTIVKTKGARGPGTRFDTS